MPPPPPPPGAGPYGQPQYGQPQYGQPQYGMPQYGPPTREHPQGTTVLVLGILSLLACGILGPFAWKMGNDAIREMDANPNVLYSNRGNITAGRICGIVASCILIAGAVFAVLFFIFAVAVGTSGG